MAYGMQGHLGICFQESFGTAHTNSFHWLPIISESLSENIPPLLSEGMRGRFEEGDTYEGPHDIGGDIVLPAHPVLIGKLLKAWCGQSSGTLNDSCYTHKFQPRNVDFDAKAAVPPMTIEIYRDAGSAHQYYDCLCEGFSIEIAYGQIVKTTMNVIGGQFAKASKSQPSYLPGSEYTWDQTSISVAGPAVDELTQMTISGANNLEGKGTLDGGKVFNRIKRTGFRTLEVAGTILFANDTEFDNFRNQTNQRFMITITGQDVSSGYPGKLEIDLPRVRYSEFPINIGGPGLIEGSFKGAAKYDSGSGTMVEFTLVNTQSQY